MASRTSCFSATWASSFTRLLSLYHVVWPLLLIFCLRRVGYDPRGYPFQAAVAAGALVLSRLAGPVVNANFAFTDPPFGRAFGPPPVHLAVIFLMLAGVIYGLTHLVLRATLPPHQPSA